LDTFKSFEEILPGINDQTFEDIALKLFRFQSSYNPVYKKYLHHLGVDPNSIRSIDEIPFLPISFFKTHSIVTGEWRAEEIFTSSGTTGSNTSRHLVHSLNFYQHHCEQIFQGFFGALQNYHILALLPSYLEREGSSLVYMVDYFIRRSGSEHSGFYLNNVDALLRKIDNIRRGDRQVLLLGVSFALLDLAETGKVDMSNFIVMETGGMKGRRREMTREELHEQLKSQFNCNQIYSEYGMTELLSQAYSQGKGIFRCSPGMKILIRDINDPFFSLKNEKTGIINVIDLANIYSCSFIETQDLGRVLQNGNFEVLGRVDNSDVRGCNLLVE
jgi:phenylacetate-coenzyme A ligase PaaK-like adenylate-forming protein